MDWADKHLRGSKVLPPPRIADKERHGDDAVAPSFAGLCVTEGTVVESAVVVDLVIVRPGSAAWTFVVSDQKGRLAAGRLPDTHAHASAIGALEHTLEACLPAPVRMSGWRVEAPRGSGVVGAFRLTPVVGALISSASHRHHRRGEGRLFNEES